MGLFDIFKIGQFKAEIDRLNQENEKMHQQLQELGAFDYYQIREKITNLENEYSEKCIQLNDNYRAKEIASEERLKKQISSLENTISERKTKSQELLDRLNELMLQEAKLSKNVKIQTNAINRESFRKESNFSSTDSANEYHKKIEKEHQNNSVILESDIAPFRNKPFSLSSELMFDYGIPYFYPTDSDKAIIENDIKSLINKAIKTGIFKSYDIGKSIEYAQIRTAIYTPTKKIKKFPISVYINDGITFYVLFYTQNGKLGKADLTYTPNTKLGYTINFKEYSNSLEVRRICSYPIGGGSTTELYCKE